ncbi:MFS-type transporter SLC18B1-like isoform X2 [Tachypleus tridentatus]|uniref:MFS-type transporter SLC18B1-like isoform X2 n=1 Tax=Tachypleus tridentatus TaxID=6853 RepID=UPI003FCF2C0C
MELENSTTLRSKYRWMTRRQMLTLTTINFSVAFLASCFALLAPFFPELVLYVTPKFIVVSGTFIAGCCSLLFGTLNRSPPGTPFIALAFILRSVKAVGAAAIFTVGYTIVGAEFDKRRATAFASIELSYGFGTAIGPAVGGLLYEIGGYMVPFFVLGGILMTLTLILFLYLPESEQTFEEESGNFFRVILDFGFFVDMLNILTGLLFIGFNGATLEPHIRQFDLKHSTIGLIFIISGGVYVCGTLFWGHVSDKMPNSRAPLFLASALYGTTCLLLGPAPFISTETCLWMVIVSQVPLGLGSAAKLVVGFNHSLKHTISRGFPDDIPTIATVAGAFNCVNSLGEFIGPSIGGVLLEKVGYKTGTMVLLGFEMAIFVVTVGYSSWLTWKRTRFIEEEKIPVLSTVYHNS